MFQKLINYLVLLHSLYFPFHAGPFLDCHRSKNWMAKTANVDEETLKKAEKNLVILMPCLPLMIGKKSK